MTPPAAAAARLAHARKDGELIERFTAAEPTLDATWGLAVQDLDRAARLAAGERLVGAKLGLTSAAKQQTMRVHEPIVGFLTDAMDSAAHDHLTQPRVEPEIALVLSRDLSEAPADPAAWVESACLALEVLDSRYADYRFAIADVLADNTSAAGFVLGTPVSPGDLAGLTATWTVDGTSVEVRTDAILGNPWAALTHLGRHLAARGETLPAGSVVLLGAMTDAVPLPAGVLLEAPGWGSVGL